MSDKPVFVTQPSLAPLEEYTELLKGVWERGILTHNGPLVQQLEKELCHTLGLKHFVAVSNGTIALQMAIRALNLKGEIITSPFTWVATVSAIQWEGCTPVFADIDPETLNIDPENIAPLINERTVAIMPVHVFGNPCEVEAIAEIARQHKLKVIYDAAHAIGSTVNGRSVLEYGDISATSLHATKLLNTAEGGGCITSDPNLATRLQRIRFFGHNEEKDIVEEGFNGKLTEVHAALGLANLKYYQAVLQDREEKYRRYEQNLQAYQGSGFQVHKTGETNYSYFPLIFPTEEALLGAQARLQEQQFYPRRYFYPSVNTFSKIIPYQPMPISEDISKRILCLPLYYKLEQEQQDKIIEIILNK